MKKYNMGGSLQQLLPLLDLATPGLGTAASTVAGVLQQANAFGKQTTPLKSPTNPFRTYKMGGSLKQYNLPSHEHGGGMIDKMGNPSNSSIAEIEKQEAVFTSKKGATPYVFSDTLVDSDGKTFAMKAKDIEKKYSGRDMTSKNTYKKLMDELTIKNEVAKKMQKQIEIPQATQMPNGGLIPNVAMDALIEGKQDTRLRNDMMNTFDNIQSMNLNKLGVLPTIPSGFDRMNNKLPDISKPTNTIASSVVTSNPLGSLDLGKVGGILKGVALAGSAIDAFQKPEEEQLRVPDFSKGDKAYAGLGTSFDPIRNDIVQQAKSGENQILQSSGNFGQVMSRLNTLQAGVGRNLANVGLQEKQYNDQIRMAKGSREDQKAGIIASEQIRKQTTDSQNKAMRQDLIANLLQNVNNYGTEFMKQDATMKQLTSLDKQAQRDFLTQLSLLNIQNPNFQIDKTLINSDNPLSALKFKN